MIELTSHHQRILSWLDDGTWRCGKEMESVNLRQLVKELKENGYVIEGQRCKLHRDHESGTYQRRLIKSV